MVDAPSAVSIPSLIDAGLIVAGLFLGWLLPVGFVQKSWRRPIAAFLIGAGVALIVLRLR
jgi:hypothetical protein